jgi:hypothetical protein
MTYTTYRSHQKQNVKYNEAKRVQLIWIMKHKRRIHESMMPSPWERLWPNHLDNYASGGLSSTGTTKKRVGWRPTTSPWKSGGKCKWLRKGYQANESSCYLGSAQFISSQLKLELHKYSVPVAAIQETGWNVREAWAVMHLVHKIQKHELTHSESVTEESPIIQRPYELIHQLKKYFMVGDLNLNYWRGIQQ